MSMRGTLTHTITLGADVFGNITRMDNMLDSLATKQAVVREELVDTENQLARNGRSFCKGGRAGTEICAVKRAEYPVQTAPGHEPGYRT